MDASPIVSTNHNSNKSPLMEMSLARFHCRNINTLFVQQMGFSPERTQMNQHWQRCESITQQYLAERGLLKVEE